MSTLCRTCGQEAEHTRELFYKENSVILNNLRKLTGIWLTLRPGVPTGICLSCLLDLNEAVVFRELCIKTNHLWFEEEDNQQNVDSAVQEVEQPVSRGFSPELVELKIDHFSSVIPQKVSIRGNKQPNRSNATNESDYLSNAQAVPSVEVMDPIMINNGSIKVESEHFSDIEAEDSTNKTHSRVTEDNVPLKAQPRGRHKKNITEVPVDSTEVISTATIKVEIDPALFETEPEDFESQMHTAGNEEIVQPTAKRRGRPRKGESIKISQALPKPKRDQKVIKKRRSQTARVQANALNKFFCDQCGKAFSEMGNLNSHLQRHTGVKQFECEVCGRKEFSKHLLKLHVRIKHQGELPYVCKYCGQRFGNCNLRLRHERQHNPQPRQYKCPICDKGFKEKSTLKKHSVVHTGERPFHCELCNTDFSQRNSFRTHLRSIRHLKKVKEQQKKPQDEDDHTLLDSKNTHGRGLPSLGSGNRSVNVIKLSLD